MTIKKNCRVRSSDRAITAWRLGKIFYVVRPRSSYDIPSLGRSISGPFLMHDPRFQWGRPNA